MKAGKEAEKCHLRTAGLVMGVERVQSVEFPSLERQQVTMLALDFGELPPPSFPASTPTSPSSPEKPPVLDAPNVVDVAVTALHDLHLKGAVGGGPSAGQGSQGGLVLQASYTDQVMRSSKIWTEVESARVNVVFDCTFRVCAANSHLILMLLVGDAFPGECMCACRINLLRVAQQVKKKRASTTQFLIFFFFFFGPKRQIFWFLCETRRVL